MIYLSVLLTISLIFNVVFYWYNRQIIKNLIFIMETTKEFTTLIHDYGEHLEKVYNKEAFYGDQVLEALLVHTKDMTKVAEEVEARINNIWDLD